MKKVISIFLLVCLTAPFLGSLTWLSFKKREIRKEIKHRIKAGMTKEELVLLTFTSFAERGKIRWEHAGEFEYKGQMYDVVKTEIHGDTIHYWCFWDQKETILSTRIKELVAKTMGNNPQNKENQKRLIIFLQTFYFPGQFTWNPENSNKHQGFPPSIKLHCLSGFYEPFVPPPKLS